MYKSLPTKKVQLLMWLFMLSATANAQDPQLIFNKSFADSTVVIGETTTLTFTMENPTGTFVAGLFFNDDLPEGLTIAATPNITRSCPSGSITALAGTNNISFTNGTLSESSTCNITVDVEGTTLGEQNNVTSPLSTTTAGIGDGDPATASISVLTEFEWGLAGVGNWFEATNWNPVGVPNGDMMEPIDEIASINNGGTAQVFSSSTGMDEPARIFAADLNIGINGGNGNLIFMPDVGFENNMQSFIFVDSSMNVGYSTIGTAATNGTLTISGELIENPIVSLSGTSDLRIGVNEAGGSVEGTVNLTSFVTNPELEVFSDTLIGATTGDGNATGTVTINGIEAGLPVNGSNVGVGLSIGSGNATGTITGGQLVGVPMLFAGVSVGAGDSNAILTSQGRIGQLTMNVEAAQIGVSSGTGNAMAQISQNLDLQADVGFGPFGNVDIGIAEGTGSAIGSLLASAGLSVDTLTLGRAEKGSGGGSGSLLIDHGLLSANVVDLGGSATLTLNLNGPLRATNGLDTAHYSAADAQTFNQDGDLIINVNFTPDSGQVFELINTSNVNGITSVFDSMTVTNLPTGLTANFTEANTGSSEQLLLTIGGSLTPPNWINPNTGANAGDWFDMTNWSNNTVPIVADTATINNGGLAIADSATAPGDIVAASVIVGIDGGSGSVQSNAVNITTSGGILIGTTTGVSARGGITNGNLTITDAEISTGIGFSNDTGIIGVGLASGTAVASGELMVTDSNLNVNDGIVIGFAGADEDIPSSSTGTGSFIYDGISPTVSSINLNNGNLRIPDADNEAPENSMMTAFGSASIQDVTIIGGELQITEFSPLNESISVQADATMVSLDNVVVVDNEIDVSVTNVDVIGAQVTTDANITLTDVSFTAVTDGDNFQSGDGNATATDAEVSSTVNQTWTRVNIDAQSDFRAGFGETTSNGTVDIQVTMNIMDSDLLFDQFRLGDIDASGNSVNNNTTAVSLSEDGTLNANDLRIADVVSDNTSLTNLDASLSIVDSVINIDNEVSISQFGGDSTNPNSNITASLSLDASTLNADALNISTTKDAAGTVDASLNLNPSLVTVNEVNTGEDGRINFGLEGLNRVTLATVGTAGTYAGIDTRSGILSGEIIADFNFTPPPGSHNFDLIIADSGLNTDAATLTVNNLPPLFNMVGFGIVSENKLDILRLTIEGGNDLSISKLNGEFVAGELDMLTYIITVTNNGADDAIDVNVIDILPTTLNTASWTCIATGNAACSNASGMGDINELVDITAGDSVEFALSATVVGNESEIISNTATLIPPLGFVDAIAENNSATDEDSIGLFIDSFEGLEEE